MTLLPGEKYEGEFISDKVRHINDKLIGVMVLLAIIIIVEVIKIFFNK